MTKIYRYILNTAKDDPYREIRKYLEQHKIKYSEGLLLTFEIPENIADFKAINDFLYKKKRDVAQVRLEYSKKELDEAKYFIIWLKKYSGYPQPEVIDIKNSYINYTYDTKDFCIGCGGGLVQNDSFYVKSSFNIEKVCVGGLYWVYDTLFITNELKELFVKENFKGIDFLPVKNIKTRQITNNAIQLKINSVFPEDLKYEIKKVIDCNICNRKKVFAKDDTEYFASKEILNDLDKDFYLSREYTGDGLLCCNRIIISNRVYKFLNSNKIKNMNVIPVKFQ